MGDVLVSFLISLIRLCVLIFFVYLDVGLLTFIVRSIVNKDINVIIVYGLIQKFFGTRVGCHVSAVEWV